MSPAFPAYRLIRARENIGYLQTEAADLLGPSGRRLAVFESGNKKPEYSDLMNMAQLYHVDFDFLTADIPEDKKEVWPDTTRFKNGILRNVRIRSENHYMLEEAARELMIDKHQLFLIEYGAVYPDDELLENMALLYGVPVEKLAKVRDYELITYFPPGTTKKTEFLAEGPKEKVIKGTGPERRIAKYLDSLGLDYWPEFPVIDCENDTEYRLDFLVFSKSFDAYKDLAIEYDGIFHFKNIKHRTMAKMTHFRDKEKTRILEEDEIPFLRIRFDEEDRIEELIDDFLAHPEDFLTSHSRIWDTYYDFDDLKMDWIEALDKASSNGWTL